MGKRTPLRPSWTANLGALIGEGIEVRAHCDRCEKWKDVDLHDLAASMGPDYDLWNRRTRCRFTPGCEGWNKFLHSGRGPLQPMWD